MRGVAWIAAGILGLAVTGGVTLFATYQHEFILTEANKAEFVGQQQSLYGVKSIAQLDGDGAFVALNRSVFDKASAALSGKSVTVHSKELNDDVQLTVKSLTLQTESGRITAQLDLIASDSKRGITVGLNVEGFLVYTGSTEEDSSSPDGPTDAANFKFVPVKVVPQIQYGFLNLRGRRFTSDTIANGSLSFLFDKLAWKVTYRPHVSFAVGSPETIKQHFGDDNSGAVDLIATPSPFRFDQWLNVVAPVFTSKGVVLTATLTPTRQAPTAIVHAVADNVSDADLGRARQEVQAKAGTLDRLFASDVAVTVGREAFTKLTDQIAGALAGFNISVQGKSISGRLFDKKWRDDILGEGGFFAEIQDASRIQGRVNIAKPSIVLDQEHGPSLSLPVSASFSAPLHVHFDPLIGGGIGSTILMQGSATTTLRAWFATTKFPFEGRTIAVAGPVMSCGLLDIDARTDGRLKIGGGVATVPQIGARAGVLVGSNPLAPSFVSGSPISITIVPPAKQEERSTDRLSVIDGLFASFSLNDFSAELGADGYRVAYSFDVALGNQPFSQPSPENVERLRKAAIDHWNATIRQPCPDLPSIRIEVGDLEIGPNGEIMKFLKNSWDDITKGPGKGNEVVKLLGRIQAAAGGYDEATKKAANDVGDMAKRAFPTNSDVGHAAGEVAKSVTIVVTNPTAAATGFVRQLFNGFK
jgi:hypothetical protein